VADIRRVPIATFDFGQPFSYHGVCYDPIDGIGATPNHQAMAYRGVVLFATPDEFLAAAHALGGASERGTLGFLDKALAADESVCLAPPMLYMARREGADTWRVAGHEGRHRATVLKRRGVEKIPIFILFSEPKLTAKDITSDVLASLWLVRGERGDLVWLPLDIAVVGGKALLAVGASLTDPAFYTKAVQRAWAAQGPKPIEVMREKRPRTDYPEESYTHARPKRTNPDPERDRALRAEALRRWGLLRTWLTNTTRARMKASMLPVQLGRYSGAVWFQWAATIDPASRNPVDTAITIGLGPTNPERPMSPGSFFSLPSPAPFADRGYLHFLILNGVLKKAHDLTRVETRVVGFKEVFVHETIHLLDRLRWSPAGWPAAMASYQKAQKTPHGYHRHPLEWNAYYQAGWQQVEDFMQVKARIETVRPGASLGLGATLARGWDEVRTNLSSFWPLDWITSIRTDPKLWKKFLARARRAYDAAVPTWRAMLRNAKLQAKRQVVAAKKVQAALRKGKRPTKALLRAAGLA
jgi:hypothetical protein